MRRLLASTAFLLPLALSQGETKSAGAEMFEVDPVHSSVIFRIKHLGVSYFYGRFNDVSGKILFDAKNPVASSVEAQIKAESVDTNSADRDKHLRSPDFFNAKQFPAIAFKSRSVKKADATSFEVTGDLTLHGVTKPLTVKMTHVGTGDIPKFGHRAGFEGTFTVKRSEFGMTFMSDLLGDDVQVTIGLEGVRK
jgi:polyisoprenoid-binding protein YceI